MAHFASTDKCSDVFFLCVESKGLNKKKPMNDKNKTDILKILEYIL